MKSISMGDELRKKIEKIIYEILIDESNFRNGVTKNLSRDRLIDQLFSLHQDYIKELREKIEGLRKNYVSRWPNSHPSRCICDECQKAGIETIPDKIYFTDATDELLYLLNTNQQEKEEHGK